VIFKIKFTCTQFNKEEYMTLTKADLTQQVYEQHNLLTHKQAAEAVDAILRISKDSLIGGSDLLLSGFGKFNVRDKRPRSGRNPQTGEQLTLEARRVVTFKPSGILRKRINGS
jgi:integration host factor subunit alpha